MSKRRLREAVPLNPGQMDAVGKRVLETINNLELPKDRFVLVGSAALVMYGITPPSHENKKPGPRPHDVDLTISGKTFAELAQAGQTPNGVLVADKNVYAGSRKLILTANSTDNHFPVDLITSYSPRSGKSLDAHDTGFNRHYQTKAHTIPETTIRVASLEHIATELRRNRHIDQAAALDYRELLKHQVSRN